MAIVLTSKFNPFTYEELVRPAMEMTKAHQEVEQALGELKAESMKMQNLANKETDPIAHAQYQRYASDLALQAASLARSGLRTSSRRDLYDMASRYQAEIVPIDTASKKREALVNQQRALRLQNPTMLFEREAAGMSLDELIQNPNADYGHAISGDFLAKQVATAASVLAKEARDSEEGKGKLKKMMLPFQYEYIKQKGFSREAVMEAILRGPNANKILTGIVDGVIKSSGVLDWGDRNTIAKAYNYANQGLYSAIGETTSQIVTDTYGAQRAAARAAARAASKSSGAKDQLPAGLKYLSQNKKFLTKKQKNELEDKIQKYVKKGYIATDEKGNIIGINRKGADAYRNARVVVKDKDLQLGTYGTEIQYLTGDGFGTATRHTGFVPKGKGKQITNSGSNPMGDMSKVISHINKVGKQRYGDRFSFGSSDMEFYNMMNELAAMQTGNKNAKAWYGQDDWQIGQWGINQQSKLITDAWKTMHGGEDLIGYNAVQVNVKDSDSERLMSDIAYNTSGSKIDTYTVNSKGQWQIDDDVDKGILNKYKPHSVVTLQDGKPYIELREKALDVNSGQYTNKFSTKGEVIYVPAPSGGHWGNYGNNVQAYYTSQAIVDDYNKQMSTTNTYDGDIEAVLAAYKNIHQDNPNNLIISSEKDLLNALGAAGSTTINLGNTDNLGWE